MTQHLESADLAGRISKFLCLQKSAIVNCWNSKA